MTKALKVLAIGKSGRLDCIVDGIHRSRHPTQIYVLSEVENPGLRGKAVEVVKGKTDDVQRVEQFARRIRPDLAIIGPEEPLAAGVVDKLQQLDIPCVGPTRSLARIESSKSFTRQLLAKYNIR
jgi:phosphoribosylamine--glycine ligase